MDSTHKNLFFVIKDEKLQSVINKTFTGMKKDLHRYNGKNDSTYAFKLSFLSEFELLTLASEQKVIDVDPYQGVTAAKRGLVVDAQTFLYNAMSSATLDWH